MDEARASLVEGKKNMAALTERVQSLQSELNQSELRREDLEAELDKTQEVREKVRPCVDKHLPQDICDATEEKVSQYRRFYPLNLSSSSCLYVISVFSPPGSASALGQSC